MKYWSQISNLLVDWYWLCMSLKPSTIISPVSIRVLYSMKRASMKVPKTRPWSSGMWPQSGPLSRGHIITCLWVICASVIHVAKYLTLRQTSGVYKGEELQGVCSTQYLFYFVIVVQRLKSGDYLWERKWLNTQKKCKFEKPNNYLPTAR